MIRTLLATTAIAALLSTGALAANDMAKPGRFYRDGSTGQPSRL